MITILKATPTRISINFLSLFVIPRSIDKQIEKLQQDFPWKGRENSLNIHLVDWKVVCRPKDEGHIG